MTGDFLESQFHSAASAVRQADALLIGAGAGMGVDSGLPDFRGREGFWRAYPPFKKLGLSFVDVANPRWFHSDPHQAWGFYGHRRNLYGATDPHAGFEILLRWAQEKPAGYFVFTSNVDAHFQRSGFEPHRVVECHGSLCHMQCMRYCTQDIWEASDEEISIDETTFRASDPLPTCPCCGSLARPNVLMFGDGEWLADRSEEQWQRYENWLESLADKKLAIIECGAGLAVPTVRYECERRGGKLIRINPREPQAPGRSIEIACGALEAISAIDALLSSD